MYLASQRENLTISTPKRPHLKFSDTDYLAIICHEIATPLNAIIGLSQIISSPECNTQKKSECAEMLRDSSDMLMGLLRNMLDCSKIDAGMLEMEEIEFNLKQLFHEASNIVRTKAAEKGLDLNVYVSHKLPRLYQGDPLRIRQILINLLTNAIKFTAFGHVSLYVNPKIDSDGNRCLCITVADTGIGIPKASLDKIFSKYVQADISMSRKYGGTGLGLSISQNLAHLMNGHITVKSWPGMGSHFIVTLPLKRACD